MKRVKRYFSMGLLYFLLCLPAFSRTLYLNLNQQDDWQPVHDVSEFRSSSDGITFKCTDADPYIQCKPLSFSAKDYAAIVLEIRVSAGSQAQLFWSRADAPGYGETRSKHIDLTSDDAFHSYTLILSNHPEWKGEITQFRLDPTDARAQVCLRSFQMMDRAGSVVSPVYFHANHPMVAPGETIRLSARFRNEGDENGNLHVNLGDLPSSVQTTNPKGTTLSIEPFTEKEISWELKTSGECAQSVPCDWSSDGASSQSGRMQALILALKTEPASKKIEWERGESRAILYRTGLGFGPIEFSITQDGQSRTMAVMPYLGRVQIQENDGSQEVDPLFAPDSGDMEANIRTGKPVDVVWRDRDNREWKFSLTILPLDSPAGAFRLIHTLESDGGRLLHFSGPELYMGEGDFGGKKDMAVFPGIEYLDRDAVSSSDAVAHPPVRDQYAPHPYKNTIPFMSLTHNGAMISLLWPAMAKWASGQQGLSPVFAVPNRWQGQDNHLFSLFVPQVPISTLENQETAFQPYLMKAGEPVRIESTVYLKKGNDPNDALPVWIELYGGNQYPEPVTAPRSYGEEIQLSRQAYLHSCWDETAQGWGHCAGWKAFPSGGMLALLDLDAYLKPGGEDQNAVRERTDLVYKKIVDSQGPGGLGVPAGCHVMTLEPAFYWGVTEYCFADWIGRADGLRRSQNPDGSWGFHPSGDQQILLGKDGEVVSGTISPNAMFLMRVARITGDRTTTEAGLKALDALNRETVPRGAQGWECPIAAADILVSAQACRANLDAYQITGERKYLDQAVYWARSGIIFHYLWNLPERPLQRYACIPIFGTTFFSHTWLGVPVQWCGLVYAYSLQELAAFDHSHPWQRIAEGIINSAMLQQVTEEKNIGTLPDSYGDYFETARGAWINPENIMTNLHELKGNHLDIRTVFPDGAGVDRLRMSANAEIGGVSRSGDGLRFSVASKVGRKTEIVLTPIANPPVSVQQPNAGLRKVDRLFGTEQSWEYLPDKHAILIHLLHDEETEWVQIQF